MANTPWFVKEDYLASKLAQLVELDAETYGEWTTAQVEEAITAAGLTPEEHFNEFGAEELTSPNAYFDANYYLAAKAEQLNASVLGGQWTAEKVAEAFAEAGLTPWTHFQLHGWAEGVNPSANFDVNAYLEAKAADAEVTVEEVKEAFIANGFDPISHYELHGKEEGIEPQPVAEESPLTEALEAYLDAQAARAEFLVEALENEYVAEEAGADATAATGEDLEDALEAATGAVDFFVEGFEDASANVKEALLVDEREAAEAELEDAQEAAADARAAFNSAATAAEKRLAKQYEMRAAELEAAKDARDDLRDEAESAVAAFAKAQNARDGVTMDPIDFPDDWAFETIPTIEITVDGTPVLLAEFQPFTDESGEGRIVITADGMGVAGLQSVVDALNAALAANDALAEVREVRDEVWNELRGLETVGELYNDVVVAEAELEEAQAYLDALDAAVADYRELVELNAQYEELDEAVTAARDAITNEVDGDPAGLGITLLEGNQDFTINDDVYIFDEAQTLDNFGAIGLDKIYFGEGYTLVALNGADINGNVGNIDALEIFWLEDAAGLQLYVETETFGGNASGTEDMIQLTLTGVQAADITDDLVAGFITAGTAA